jgi:hypothetical protein
MADTIPRVKDPAEAEFGQGQFVEAPRESMDSQVKRTFQGLENPPTPTGGGSGIAEWCHLIDLLLLCAEQVKQTLQDGHRYSSSLCSQQALNRV